MLGVSGLMGSSGDGSCEAAAVSSSVPGGGREGSGGGNRWPRQETLALLKIRSDMDAAFRDSSLKSPLWDEVSRKMGELGYQRRAKKCKEKFENVFKYHKRTKDRRASKSDGKTYRFFNQLEAFETPPPPPPRNAAISAPPPPPSLTTTANAMPPQPILLPLPAPSPNPVSIAPLPPQVYPFQPTQPPASILSYSTSTSSTSSDEHIRRRWGRRRKWKEFFEQTMKDIIYRQEELQTKLLATLDHYHRERAAREDAWRAHESARLAREHDLLVQERSAAAVRDAAIIAFLQKFTDPNINNNNSPPPPSPKNRRPPSPQVQPPIIPLPSKPAAAEVLATPTKITSEISGKSLMAGSSSR